MKKNIALLAFSTFIAILFSSCQRGPEKVAEEYMKIHCKLVGLNEKYQTASEEERLLIDKEIELIQQEAISLNDEIYQKYGQDTAALALIQNIYINYQCPQ